MKAVLTMIAIAMSALALGQLGPAAVQAVSPDRAVDVGTGSTGRAAGGGTGSVESLTGISPMPVAAGSGSRAPSSGVSQDSHEPLRWRVPFAMHTNATLDGSMDCLTVVKLLAVGPDPISFDVEFHDDDGGLQGEVGDTLDPGAGQELGTDGNVDTSPFFPSAFADTGNFDGYALVFADDPRVGVQAFLVCHEEASLRFPVSVTSLEAFAEGETVSFFQAGTGFRREASGGSPTVTTSQPGEPRTPVVCRRLGLRLRVGS